MTHRDYAEKFAELLKAHFAPSLVSIVLYGSVASGKCRPDSDIDLLVVLENLPAGRSRRRRQLDPLFEEWTRSHPDGDTPFISTLLKTPDEAKALSPVYFDMIDRHEMLWDKGGFMKGVLEKTKERLDRLGAKRRRLGKIEYWDLKPDYKPGDIFEI